MREHVAIIIPTRDNRRFLEPCIRALRDYTHGVDYHIYIVNNGEPSSCDWADGPYVRVLEHGTGVGWVDGLQAGMDATDAPFLLFLNDDTLVPPSDPYWLAKMVGILRDSSVGAVGPCSNYVNGQQSMWIFGVPQRYCASFLVGFCMLVRRQSVVQAGGLDTAIQFADDMDLSYRIRKAGYTLVGARDVFVWHAGAITGTRVHGASSTPGGYYSAEWFERDRLLLTIKHGAGVHAYLAAPEQPEAYTPPGHG